MNEYAKVIDGVVVQVIVSDPVGILSRIDGPWVLTPYDGITGKVAVGYPYVDGQFVFPQPDPNVEPGPF